MSFKCGIVGLPNVGKSTLFNALTQSNKAQAANFPFCTIDPNIGKHYTRIRIGIGHPKDNSTGIDYVLNNFSHDEKESVEEVTNNIIESLSILIKKDLDLFSSKVNQK